MQTRFDRWLKALEEAGPSLSPEKELAADTAAIDPDGEGVSRSTIRRIRAGKPGSAKGIRLLMEVTGLPFDDFLPSLWLKNLSLHRC